MFNFIIELVSRFLSLLSLLSLSLTLSLPHSPSFPLSFSLSLSLSLPLSLSLSLLYGSLLNSTQIQYVAVLLLYRWMLWGSYIRAHMPPESLECIVVDVCCLGSKPQEGSGLFRPGLRGLNQSWTICTRRYWDEPGNRELKVQQWRPWQFSCVFETWK